MDIIYSFVKEFGEVNGLLILGVVFMFLWIRKLHSHIYLQYQQQLQDRQREIDRLAADNNAYRERYLVALNKQHEDEVGK